MCIGYGQNPAGVADALAGVGDLHRRYVCRIGSGAIATSFARPPSALVARLTRIEADLDQVRRAGEPRQLAVVELADRDFKSQELRLDEASTAGNR